MSGPGLSLDPQSLPATVSRAHFDAGLALYRQQRVSDCTLSRVNSGEWGIAGTVRGHGREAYEVSVTLEASPDGRITFFSGSCACRQGTPCPHGVALALKACHQAAQSATARIHTPSALLRARTTAGLFDVAPPREALPPSLSAPSSAPSSTPSAPTPLTPFRAGPSLDLFGDDAADQPSPEPEPEPAAVIRRVTPIARLHLTAVAADWVEQRGLLCASLRFDYQGLSHYALNDHNPVTLDTAAGRLLLHRDLETEHAAHHRLHALGLSGDSQGRFLRPFISEAQQQPWLVWLDDGFAALKAAGFDVSAEPGLAGLIARADGLQARMEAEPGPPVAQREGEAGERHTAWFGLSLGMHIDGERRNILPLLPELLAQLGAAAGGNSPAAGTLQLPAHIYMRQADGRYWRLPCEPLRPWLQALLDLMAERGGAKDGHFSGDRLRLSRQEALRLGTALPHGEDAAVWQGADSLRALVAQLAGHRDLPEVAAPAGLRAVLRPYQLHGLRWLQFLRAHHLGGILADDMGLGKTLQTLAHILAEKEAGRLDRPVLILAPVSLMGNWQREAARFTPGLRVIVLQGQQRHRAATRMSGCDVVIAPYSLLQRDEERWQRQAWHLVVLDEAQNIKNANTHAARVAAALDTRHRLCLSGTPMENHLGEVWSLFHFLMPGFLGSAARFKALYRTPIEKHGDTERMDQLRRRVTPFMLRRTKRAVATDLPDKQESVVLVTLGDAQADLYETIRLATEKTVHAALANKGLAQSQIQILDALVKLRQVCCDPRLLASHHAPHHAAEPPPSAKLQWLMDTLPALLDEGRRVLLFSQFTSMLALIEQALPALGVAWAKLTGQTQQRDEVITRFTSGRVPLFLISLKAGGVGLNLPQADTVIHFDPWWNPAVENQATDRAHRIGQTQSVLVYKLVAQGTIEERILALQHRKARLAGGLYGDAHAPGQALFTEDDLAALLEPLES